jgi:hypothetical protein
VRFSDYPSFGVGFGVVFTKYQEPITKSPLFVKDRPTHHFFALERISHFTILFAFLSSKNAPSTIKKLSIHGVEQAFYACVKSSIRTPLPCAAGPRAAQQSALETHSRIGKFRRLGLHANYNST